MDLFRTIETIFVPGFKGVLVSAAVALVSGWDFEKDLEQIFAAETAALTSTAAETSTAAQTSTAAGTSTALETSTGGAAVSSTTGKAAARKK